MFKNKKFITKGVESDVALLLQLFMWQCINKMNVPKDYLQVFDCTVEDGKQKKKKYAKDVVRESGLTIRTLYIL